MMRRYRTIAPYLLPLVCVAALLCVAAQKKESGDDPYTPTKLEWLAVEANAKYREDRGGDLGYMVNFYCRRPNTLLMRVVMQPECDRNKLNQMIDIIRQGVENVSQGYKWDHWVVIREEIEVFDPDKRARSQ